MLKLIFNRWVVAIIGLLVVGVLIWFVGPLIAIADIRPLESELARWIVIGAIVLLFLAKALWRVATAQKSNAQLMAGLTAPVAAPAVADPASQESAGMQKHFEEAITVLKQTTKRGAGIASILPGRQYLYDLPWYVFIGAPGSGKTTALVNSGLQFPLAERFGQQKVRGVGGTRNCDWWFTDEAVFLDTAGRYTTQESNEEVDRSAWTSFLRLLKKYRPRRPINGVIVAVSAADVLQQGRAKLEAQSAAIRSRIKELHEQFGIRFPVYVMVTKTDLLPGFMEFFGEFGRDERAQVWGVSFPLTQRDSGPLPDVRKELAALEQRLNARLIDRLERENDPQKRALIYAFPQHFATFDAMLVDFLTDVFEPSRFETQPMVRGVYFTSGTQEGSPIDRMMGQMARALRLEQKLLPPNQASGKAYFITRLIKDVLFAETGLAGTNIRWERRRAAVQWAALSVAIVVTACVVTAWTISFSRNTAYVAEVDSKQQTVARQVGELQARQNPDVVALLPTLDAVRNLAATSADGSAPWSMEFGLYQGKKLGAASRAAYRRLIQDAFLPRLQARIEQHLRARGAQNPDLLYESLKAYVMLGDPQHFDADALKAYITADWDTNLPREVTAEQRKDLASHLDTLLAQGPLASPIVPDAQLVSATRDLLARTATAQRIYGRLKRQDLGANLPEFTIAAAAGPTAQLVFARGSGEPLTKGVPGLYSFDGYYNAFIPAAKDVTQQLADEESWVLGIGSRDKSRFLDPRSRANLDSETRRLFLEDYANVWMEFVNDIKLVPARNLQAAIELAQVLSAPESPLPALLRGIVKEVTLITNEEPKKDAVDKARDVLDKATAAARKRKDDLLKMMRPDAVQPEVTAPRARLESIVDDRFTGLRRMVQAPAPGQPAPVDATVALIRELYALLTATQAAVNAKNAPPPSDLPMKIKAEAGQLPEPVRTLLASLAQAGATQVLGETRQNINTSLTSALADFCKKATVGRYPFVRTSGTDVTQDDFIRIFAPGGLIDDFFQKNLAAYVDTSARPWKFRQMGDATMGTTSESLLQFQRAQTIRDVFFRSGGKTPALRLEFKPVEMDASITQFILDVDGQLIKYSHGPQVPVAVQWPGSRGSKQVRLQLSPPSTSGPSGQVFEGPWALFRMLDGAKIESTTQPEKFNVTFSVDGRKTQFEIFSNSVENPFRFSELEEFKCPDRL